MNTPTELQTATTRELFDEIASRYAEVLLLAHGGNEAITLTTGNKLTLIGMLTTTQNELTANVCDHRQDMNDEGDEA